MCKNEPISFVVEFKTYLKQHPEELPILIQRNDKTITHFTSKVLSPRELLFTFEHQTLEEEENITITVFVKNTIGEESIFNQTLEIIEKDGDLKFLPDVMLLQKQFKAIPPNKRSNMIKFDKRFLQNGSFAMSIHEKLNFNFVSSKYDFQKINALRRLDFPISCPEKWDSERIAKSNICEKDNSPIFQISKLKETETSVLFSPNYIGIYTFFIHFEDKITKKTYYQTVNGTNFLIVEEPITLACAGYKKGEPIQSGALFLEGSVEGLTIGLNVFFHWSLFNTFKVTTRKLCVKSILNIYIPCKGSKQSL